MLSIIILVFEILFLKLFTEPNNGASNSLSFFLIALFSFGFFLDISRSEKREPIRNPLVLGYLFRLFLVFFDLFGRHIYQLPNSGADSEWFYQQGVFFAQGISASTNGFIRLVALMIGVVGSSRLFLQFLLMLTSLVSILCIDESLSLLNIDNSKRRTAVTFMAVLPNYAILSSIFLRESLVAMCIAISILCFIRWWTYRREFSFLLSFAAAFVGAFFHSGVVSVALGLIIVRLMCNKDRQNVSISFRSIVAAIIFMFIFVYLYNNYTSTLFDKMQGIDAIEDVSNNSSLGDASYASIAGNSNTPVNMVIYTPIRMIMFQFAPFFWQIRGISDIIAMVFDSFFFMLVYYRTIKYIRYRIQDNRAIIIALLVIGLCTTFVFGWGVANFGTALRHRNKMMAIYGILLGLTMPSYEKNYPE